MAPEAIIGLKNDDFHQILKIDVWSLGITFIEFVEKIPPYFKSVPQAAIFKIVNSPPPVLTQATKYSVAFQDLIGKCLVKNPECRAWPSELLLTPFLVGASKHSEALNRIIERMYSDKEIRNRKMSVTMENRRGSKIDLFENALLGTKGMDGSRSLGSGNLLKEK
jgi:serine/threonine protein kinase